MKWFIIFLLFFASCNNPCECVDEECSLVPIFTDGFPILVNICNCLEQKCPAEKGINK